VWIEKELFIQVKENKIKTDNYFPSRNKEVFRINQQKKKEKKRTHHKQYIPHTHIHRPVWNEKENYSQTYISKLQ